MIRVAGSVLGVAVFAALSFWSGFDRMSSASFPNASRYIPAPLEFRSGRAVVEQALLREENDLALNYAARAVDSDPMHASSTALLGLSRLTLGDNDGADQAFRVAAIFGWREPATQLYWYEQALALGEWELAADRLDALLRVRPGFALFEEIVEPFQQDAAGRLQLAELLSAQPGWLARYASLDAEASEETALLKAETLALAGELHAPLGCEPLERISAALLRRGLREQAKRVWQANCSRQSGEGPIHDPGFEETDFAQYDPFGWQALRDGRLDVSIEPDGSGGARARLRNLSNFTRPALAQPVDLPAGEYMASADVEGSEGKVSLAIACGRANIPLEIFGDLAGGTQQVSVEDCSEQQLTVFLAPGGETVFIDDIRLTPR